MAWNNQTDFEVFESALNMVLGICNVVLWSKHRACDVWGRRCEQCMKRWETTRESEGPQESSS